MEDNKQQQHLQEDSGPKDPYGRLRPLLSDIGEPKLHKPGALIDVTKFLHIIGDHKFQSNDDNNTVGFGDKFESSYSVTGSLDLSDDSSSDLLIRDMGQKMRDESALTDQYNEMLKLKFELDELKKYKEVNIEAAAKHRVIETAIVKLLLEATGKLSDDQEKAVMLKEDPLVNMDCITANSHSKAILDLRMEIRSFLSMKTDFEREVRIELERRKTEFEVANEELKIKLTDSLKKNEALSTLIVGLKAENKAIGLSKDTIADEELTILNELKNEKQRSEQSLAQKDKILSDKEKHITHLLVAAKNKDAKIAKINEMEERIKELVSLQDFHAQQYPYN